MSTEPEPREPGLDQLAALQRSLSRAKPETEPIRFPSAAPVAVPQEPPRNTVAAWQGSSTAAPLVDVDQFLIPAAPGSAQGMEPADPPWLTEAIKHAAEAMWGEGNGDLTELTSIAVRAALPILRAGIEQEIWQNVIDKGADTLAWHMARQAALRDWKSRGGDRVGREPHPDWLDDQADDNLLQFIAPAVGVIEMLQAASS